MPTSLSPEGKISSALVAFGCSQRSFVELAKTLGVQVAAGPLSEALSGKRNLDIAMIESLFVILSRMNELQNQVAPAPLDWSRTEHVAHALTARLIAQIGQEERLEKLADDASKAAINVS